MSWPTKQCKLWLVMKRKFRSLELQSRVFCCLIEGRDKIKAKVSEIYLLNLAALIGSVEVWEFFAGGGHLIGANLHAPHPGYGETLSLMGANRNGRTISVCFTLFGRLNLFLVSLTFYLQIRSFYNFLVLAICLGHS